MENKRDRKKTAVRWGFYLFSFVILALGIILNTKSDFGVTPIISIPYCISEIRGLNFGNASMVMYTVLAVIEYILKGKNFRPYDLLQIPLSFLLTRLFNIFGAMLPDPANISGRIICLAFGIIFTGIGAAMSMNARLVPNPGDGIVQAISDRVHKKVGICKNCFDIGCVVTTALIGLLSAGHLIGIGIGTIAAMIFVGRVIALYNCLFGKKVGDLMGVPFINGGKAA